MYKILTILFYFYIFYKKCITISWFGSQDSTRPYDTIDQIQSKIDNPEVFGKILSFLENNNKSEDKTEVYKDTDKEDSFKTISNYLGEDIAKIIIHIANMASLQSTKSKEYEDYNLKVDTKAIMDHIATVLESQNKGFNYDKIKESIYKWASFYLVDEENCKSMKNDQSSNRVSS